MSQDLQDVNKWLNSYHLGQYSKQFELAGFDAMSDLQDFHNEQEIDEFVDNNIKTNGSFHTNKLKRVIKEAIKKRESKKRKHCDDDEYGSEPWNKKRKLNDSNRNNNNNKNIKSCKSSGQIIIAESGSIEITKANMSNTNTNTNIKKVSNFNLNTEYKDYNDLVKNDDENVVIYIKSHLLYKKKKKLSSPKAHFIYDILFTQKWSIDKIIRLYYNDHNYQTMEPLINAIKLSYQDKNEMIEMVMNDAHYQIFEKPLKKLTMKEFIWIIMILYKIKNKQHLLLTLSKAFTMNQLLSNPTFSQQSMQDLAHYNVSSDIMHKICGHIHNIFAFYNNHQKISLDGQYNEYLKNNNICKQIKPSIDYYKLVKTKENLYPIENVNHFICKICRSQHQRKLIRRVRSFQSQYVLMMDHEKGRDHKDNLKKSILPSQSQSD